MNTGAREFKRWHSTGIKNMQDPFHEAKEALKVAKREYSSVNSLSAVAAYSTNQACENSVRAIWEIATGNPFPHTAFTPFHKPSAYIERIGLYPYYSNKTQNFLNKLTGYALDEARFQNTQAYVDHTNQKSKKRAKELIDGTECFINETEQLTRKPDALKIIQCYEGTLGR